MPGSPTSTGSFNKVLAPGLRKVYAEGIMNHETMYDKIAKMPPTSKRAYEEDLQVALLGTTPTKPEGNPTFFDNPLQGNIVRYTHVSYGLGFRVTREMYDDDLYGVMRQASGDLARANAESVEQQFFSIFNLANTTAHVGFDGLALASAVHVILGGGTFSNTGGTAELSQAALQLVYDAFMRMKQDRNRVYPLRPWKLLIPPELRWVARAVLQSPYYTSITGAAAPTLNVNEINALREEGLTEFVCPYFTSAKFWHVVSREHDVKLFWRRKPTFDDGDEFSTGDALFKSYLRFSKGFSTPRGYYGSFPV